MGIVIMRSGDFQALMDRIEAIEKYIYQTEPKRPPLQEIWLDNGYENYTSYIKKLRIDDFLQQIESGKSVNFQEAFFYVGFRSRSTALRNFQQVTGVSPTEYFQKKNTLTEQ